MSFADQYNNMPDVGQAVAPSAPKYTKAAPGTSGKSGSGLLSRLIGGITAAPKYFVNNDIVDPVKQLAAQATGNKQAYNNAFNTETKSLAGNNKTNLSGALKTLAGNSAQLGATVLAPEVKGAGIGAKIVTGAKVGAVAGGGSALANNQDVLTGALEGAAVGGVVPAGAKLLGIGGKAAEAGTVDEAGALGKAKANLNNHFQQTEAGAGGFNAGAKLPGSGAAGISLDQSQKLSQLAEKYHIPAGSPATRLRYIQQGLNNAGSEIDQKLEQNNTPLTTDDKQAIMDEFHNRINEQPNAMTLKGKANELSDHFVNGSNVNDLKGLNKYRQLVDEGINYNRQAGAPDPVAEQVGTIARQTLSDQLGKYAPDVAGANKTFGELKSLEAPTLMENQKMQQTGGGLYSRLLNNNVVKGAESKGANIGQKATGGISPEANATTDATTDAVAPVTTANRGTLRGLLTSQPAQRVATVGGANAITQPTPPQVQGDDTGVSSTPGDLSSNSNLLQGSATGLGSNSTGNSSGPQFTQDQLVEAISEDPKNASVYEDLYKTLNANTSTSDNLDATQQKEVTAGEAAINGIQQYADQISQLTSGSNGNIATGTVSTLLGKYDPLASSSQKQAAALQSNKREVAIQIATSLSGGTKPSAQSVAEIENSLPDVNQSAQENQDKVNDFISRMQNNIKTYATPVSQIVSGAGL